jgi:hypothetical protein
MKNTSDRIEKTAAYASASLEELLQMLPASPLSRDIRKLVDRLDRKFKLVSLSIPVGD